MYVRIGAHGGNMEARNNMHTSVATSCRRYLTTLSPHNEPRIYTSSCFNRIGACIYAWLAFWRALGTCDVKLKKHASCNRQDVQGTSLRRNFVLHCHACGGPLPCKGAPTPPLQGCPTQEPLSSESLLIYPRTSLASSSLTSTGWLPWLTTAGANSFLSS